MSGKKFDVGKPDWSLVPWEVLEGMVKTMTYGKEKYQENPDDPNWMKVEDGKHRYFAAMMRHFLSDKKGEVLDPESGLEHLDHFLFNALCYVYFKRMENNGN